ncbi:hypothetical protein BFP72_16980 [Reichenbachiella sp. 5M10]|nr:hypothetical protein BFP72_16980 [Reichenbachiella sp. 5M10]
MLLLTWSAIAQNTTETLEVVLERYEQEQGIKFSYDAELVVELTGEFDYQPDVRDFVLEAEVSLPVQFDEVSEGYYVIKTAERHYELTAWDSLGQEMIVPTDIMVLINGDPITLEYSSKYVGFDYRPNLRDSVLIYALGYGRKSVSVGRLLRETSLNISLTYVEMQLKGITIQEYLTQGIALNASNQSVSIDTEDLPLLPGETDGDIFASIAALPGVTSPDGRAGNLFIRGSHTDQSLILFDDIPIYHRGHYYGTISPYNPKVVSNVEVYRSGFHPRLGDRVGGAVVISSDEEVDEQVQGGVGANTMYLMGFAKVPLAEDKVSLSIGARRSYPSSFQSPKLNAISESVFSGTGVEGPNGNIISKIDLLFEDYHAKVIYAPNAKQHLSLSSIYTETDVKYNGDVNQKNSPYNDQNRFRNLGFNLQWQSVFSKNWQSNFSTTLSAYDFGYVSQTGPDSESVAYNNLKDFNVREEVVRSFGRSSLVLGADYKWQKVEIEYADTLFQQPVFYEEETKQLAYTLAPYINLEWNQWEKWNIQLGVRGSYYSLMESFQLDPRVFVNYRVMSPLTLKASAGRYHQYLSQVKYLEFGGGGFDNELWTLADGENGHIILGTQATLGFMLEEGAWILDVEAFHKGVDGFSIYEGRRYSPTAETLRAKQTIDGVDVLLKRQLGAKASVWASYTYSQSDIVFDSARQRSYPAKYVQPHVFYFGGAYYHERWKVSMAYKWATGLVAKSLDMVYAEGVFLQGPAPGQAGRPARGPRPDGQQGGTPPPRPPNPFAEVGGRYPNMHSLDLSVSYRIPPSETHDWSMSFGLSIINVFNQVNLIDRVYRGNPTPAFLDRDAIGFAPNLMVLVEW